MPYSINICLEQTTNEHFLLIAEQHLDGAAPEIKAQVYFTHPATKLEGAELLAAAFPISRSEIEELLNRTQERHPVTSRYANLFSHGKIDKNTAFKIFNYPSVVGIEELMLQLGIKQLPEQSKYFKRHASPDTDHVLDGKHRIAWDLPIPLMQRDNVSANVWSPNECREINLLNKLNMLSLLIKKLSANGLLNDQLLTQYDAIIEQMKNSSITLLNLKEDISRDNSPEAVREFKETKEECLTELEEGLLSFIEQLSSLPAVEADPWLMQLTMNSVSLENDSTKSKSKSK